MVFDQGEDDYVNQKEKVDKLRERERDKYLSRRE